jgi:non-lysosomal glucosylceramidase
MEQTPSNSSDCSSPACGCNPSPLGRRGFIKTTGLTAAMLMAGRTRLMAGPFTGKDFEQIIPSDKKLSKEWIASLYDRGKPLTATGEDLKYIGMPINGICTGQVYLGGDGRLWYWNLDGTKDAKWNNPKGPNFMEPLAAGTPEIQGFALRAGGREFSLDAKGFKDVTFTNRYPMATVDYADPACPVTVQLEAYTPFIPLNRDDSSHPVVVMRYTLTNTTSTKQDLAIAGWVENISNSKSGKRAKGTKRCIYRELDDISAVECSARFGESAGVPDTEVFADFEGGTYGDWKVEGEAFGDAPAKGSRTIQKLSGFKGKGVVNSWTGSDELQGKLTSPRFPIEKPFINFLLGGGSNKNNLTASLWVDGRKVRSATGKKKDAMEWVSWKVDDLKGKQAHFEILDASSGGWGHIDVDQIEFSSHPPAQAASGALEKRPDFGSIALGLFGSERPEIVDMARGASGAAGLFAPKSADLQDGAVKTRPFKERAFASLGRKLRLKPGESKTVSFAVSWHFPQIRYGTGFGRGPTSTSPGRNHYATLWPCAAEASSQVAGRETELYRTTSKWVDTWYDSTLPYWFLERAFIPINCMQTQMAQRVYPQNGDTDIYNLEEGVRCCPGNCTHVWNYAQGLARIFPEIERECRERIEYGLGFDRKTGLIYFRYTQHNNPEKADALDGTCGTIVRVLRESQMTTDYSFLASIWDRVKLSMDLVITKWDPQEDGMLEGAQHNTLDEPWYGQVHWLTNVYHAALRASAVMARRMKQPAVAERYERIVAKGAPAMVDVLWNEDFGYFIHKPGDADSEKHGSTNGCHIDQVLGDSWMHEVGLDPILPKDKIRKSLQALWKYNFTPDVGGFRKVMTNGRWYAAAGDAGLVMCSFPNGKIEPKSGHKNYAGYLNECMTGFEWQVAAHMIREGMVEQGLAIGKAIYDRYLPQDRNPYNEIECSDHYSRAMASYGAYLAMCGYQYDGPEGKLAFGPRMQQEDFRAAFTAAEGWGCFTQKVAAGQQSAGIEIRYGQLQLKELALDKVHGTSATSAKVTLDGKPVAAAFEADAERYVLGFDSGLTVRSGQRLEVSLG